MKKLVKHIRKILPKKGWFQLKTHRKFKFFILSLFLISFAGLFMYVRWALGATATWTNGGGDGLWSNCANWSGGTGTGGCPGTNDVATFNTTSTANAAIDTSISVKGILISSGYTGTITQNSGFTVTISSSGYSQADGTFTGGDSAITLNNATGSFSLTNGTFSNTSATMSIAKDMTISGGTFNNSGTVKFNSSSFSGGYTQTLSCSGTLPGTFDIAQSLYDTQTFALGSGCNITLATNVSTVGTITNSGTMNATNITMTGASFTQSGTLNLTGTLKFNASNFNGQLTQTLSCTGTLTSSGGVVDIAQSLYDTQTFALGSGCNITLATNVSTVGTITNSGTMNATNITMTGASFTQSGTLNMSGTLTFSASNFNGTLSQTLTCTGTFPATVNVAQTTYDTQSFVLSSGCTITLPASITTSGAIVNNGTITGTTMTVGGGGGATTVNNGTLTVTTFNTKGSFTQNGTLNMSGTMTFNGTNFNGTLTQTLTCTGTFPAAVNIAQTIYGTQTFILAGGCSISASGTTVGSVTNNGTISGTDISVQGNFTQNGTFTLSGTLTLSGSTTSGTVSCTNPINANVVLNKTSTGTLTVGSNCTISGDFTRTDGQIADSSSAYTLTIQGNVSLAQTDTIGGSNLTISLAGNNNQTISQNAGMIISSPISINKTAGTASLATILQLSNTLTINLGKLNLAGYGVSTSSLVVQNGGNLMMQGTEGLATPTLNSGSTVTYTGNGDSSADTYVINNWTYSNLTIAMTDSADTVQGYTSSNTLTSGLKADWKMDEAIATDPVVDSSGNVSDGTATGTSMISGHLSNARNFVSTNSDFVTIPADTDLDMSSSNVTMAVWVRTSSSYGVERMLIEHNVWANTGTYQITTPTSTSFKFNFAGAGTVPIATASFADGNWHLLASTFDDSNNIVKLYYDGSFILSGTVSSTIGSSGSVSTYIGSRGGSSLFFNGDIDESRIYNRVLTYDEIRSIYQGFTDNSFTTLTVNGNFTLSNGIFSAPSTLNVAGNFTRTGGTFTNNSGLVNLNGTNQKMYGDTTFYDLTKTASNDTLFFESGKTQTVTHTATLTGTNGAPLRLFATSPGTQAKFDPQGTRTFSYLNVKDNNNTNATIVSTSGLNINNLGGNTNWDFSGRPTADIHVGGAHIGQGTRITTH